MHQKKSIIDYFSTLGVYFCLMCHHSTMCLYIAVIPGQLWKWPPWHEPLCYTWKKLKDKYVPAVSENKVGQNWLKRLFESFFNDYNSAIIESLRAHYTHTSISALCSQAAVNNERACPWPWLISHFAAVILISCWPKAFQSILTVF